jgi:thiamine biosynthesis lipoprotein
MIDVSFPALGTIVRLQIHGPGAQEAEQRCRRWLAAFDACASRFRADSELCRLNADPRPVVPASPLLRATVGAGLWAAARTDGLVDPVVLDALETQGYLRTWDRARAMDLRGALALAPVRRVAAPAPEARWASVTVDGDAGAIARPPGLRLDTGGTGKGLAADALLRVIGSRRAVVDLGGDVALQSAAPGDAPFEVQVAHPFTGAASHTLTLTGGGVATSGIDARIWPGPDGPAHHLIDPSTGRPAWTGLVSVTALAPSALEAEVLAKAALLSGPGGAAGWLAEHGGLLVTDDGTTELSGPLTRPSRPVARVRVPDDAWRPRRAALL